jgi:hypothetical protein
MTVLAKPAAIQPTDRLSANIKITLHKALITSVMTYACPSWEFAGCFWLTTKSAVNCSRWFVAHRFLYTLKMEAIRSSETSINTIYIYIYVHSATSHMKTFFIVTAVNFSIHQWPYRQTLCIIDTDPLPMARSQAVGNCNTPELKDSLPVLRSSVFTCNVCIGSIRTER